MPGTTQTLRHDTVTLPGGLRLDTVGQGGPAGTPVVLVHGWPDSWFSWSRVLAHLDPRLRAVAYSQRGFGDSDRPPAGYGLDRFADDLLYLCDALGLAISVPRLGFLYLTASTVAAAAPTPGGVGAVEAALTAALTGAGAPPADALSAVFVFRLATYWLPIPFGWFSLNRLQKLGAI